MVFSLRSTIGVLLLTLCSLSQGFVVRRDSYAGDLAVSSYLGAAALFERQDSANCAADISDDDTPLCSSLCAPSSFSCSARPVERRNAPLHHGLAGSHIFPNETELFDPYANHLVGRRLQKRAFTPVTQGEVAAYLNNQFTGKPDPVYGAPVPLVSEEDGEETDATVVEQTAFAGAGFAIGSQGLHGCTMVTIVSAQAVYMGHFWEVPSVSGTQTQFTQRVLNAFNAGQTYVGVGPQLNPGLFPADSTRLYIMTPRNGVNNPTSTRYRRKIPTLIASIKNALNNQDVPVALYNYIPLEYSNDADAAQINSNQRGRALFQFDSNGRGAGQPGWRLFYEQHQFQDTDPAPGAASAGGIPDL